MFASVDLFDCVMWFAVAYGFLLMFRGIGNAAKKAAKSDAAKQTALDVVKRFLK